jgi:hypothetical protein
MATFHIDPFSGPSVFSVSPFHSIPHMLSLVCHVFLLFHVIVILCSLPVCPSLMYTVDRVLWHLIEDTLKRYCNEKFKG